jgi:hypothetical protein
LIIKKEPDTDSALVSKHYRHLESIPIKNLAGIPSELLVFEKCST